MTRGNHSSQLSSRTDKGAQSSTDSWETLSTFCWTRTISVVSVAFYLLLLLGPSSVVLLEVALGGRALHPGLLSTSFQLLRLLETWDFFERVLQLFVLLHLSLKPIHKLQRAQIHFLIKCSHLGVKLLAGHVVEKLILQGGGGMGAFKI